MQPIPPDYYWHSFLTVVETVLGRHGRLLSQAEQARIRALLAEPEPARRLFVRMLDRRGPLFRASRLRYPEIGDPVPVLERLAASGFVVLDPPEAFADGTALALLTVPELRAVARDLGRPLKARKPACLAALADVPAQDIGARLRVADRFAALGDTRAFTLAEVAFFGDRHRDRTAFVLAALERAAWVDVPLTDDEPLFPAREDLVAYLEAAERADAAWLLADAGLEALLAPVAEAARADLAGRPALPPHRRRVDPARYDERVCLLAGRARERAGDPAGAAGWYEAVLTHGRTADGAAEAGDRLGICLPRAGRPAADLAPLVDPWLASPRLHDPGRFRLALRLHRLGLGPDPRAGLCTPPALELALVPAGHAGIKALWRVEGAAVPVEDAVLRALGGEGVFGENLPWTTLFGLLYWDVVFAPLPGAFQHPFQEGPLDLETEDFGVLRAERLVARTRALAAADLGAEVRAAWARHRGRRCRGVAWDRVPPDLLARAAQGLGEGLLAILGRIARHPGRHVQGLPDLLVWIDGAPVLVEVKGPGDAPSVEQALWHDALLRAGVPVRIARVRPVGRAPAG